MGLKTLAGFGVGQQDEGYRGVSSQRRPSRSPLRRYSVGGADETFLLEQRMLTLSLAFFVGGTVLTALALYAHWASGL